MRPEGHPGGLTLSGGGFTAGGIDLMKVNPQVQEHVTQMVAGVAPRTSGRPSTARSPERGRPTEADSGREHDLVRRPRRAAHQALVVFRAVPVGGVDQGQPSVDRGMNRALGLRLVVPGWDIHMQPRPMLGSAGPCLTTGSPRPSSCPASSPMALGVQTSVVAGPSECELVD